MSYVQVLRGAERVTDGRTVSEYPRRSVLVVVVYEIVVEFRTDEESAAGVELQAGPELSHEVRAGRVVRAGNVVASVIIRIETSALGTDTGRQFRRQVLGQLWNVDAVEIPENGTIGLIAIVDRLAGLPGNFTHHAEILSQKKVAANPLARMQGLTHLSAHSRLQAKRRSEQVCHCKPVMEQFDSVIKPSLRIEMRTRSPDVAYQYHPWKS